MKCAQKQKLGENNTEITNLSQRVAFLSALTNE